MYNYLRTFQNVCPGKIKYFADVDQKFDLASRTCKNILLKCWLDFEKITNRLY